MFRKRDADVLVIGAGPVGMFTALVLAESGLSVRILDRDFRTAAHSYALGLHPQTLELLDRSGITAELIEAGRRIETFAFYDGPDRHAELNLSELRTRYPFLLVLPQSMLEAAFERRLKDRDIYVQWNHRLADLDTQADRVDATVETLSKTSGGYAVATTEWVIEKTARRTAAFVVGADGHRSRVRRALDIGYKVVAPADSFAVFEFRSDADLGREVRVVLDDETANVIWPLPDNRVRWSFQLTDVESEPDSRIKSRLATRIGAEAFPHLTQEELRRFIANRAPWFTNSIDDIEWSIMVRFEYRLAERFGNDRCWLVGDAGHMTGPIGVQGVNVGLREGLDLANRITGVLTENASVRSLEAYSNQRIDEWRNLFGLEGGLTSGTQTDPWVKQRCGRLLSCLPASGEHLAALAGQLGLEFKASE
jgi:2-polyprenyl-6-methoxyphenol hydroxylase-like FAD-dependent oxidoreductase